MTSPAKSSRRRRSAMIANGSAGSNSNSHHPLSHSHSRRQPFYPSSKIKSSVAWRLLASRAVRRQFAWGRLVEALSSSARSWLTRPNVLFWSLNIFSLFLSFSSSPSEFLVLTFDFSLDFPTCTPVQPLFSASLARTSSPVATWVGWWRGPETRHAHVACHGASSSGSSSFSNCKWLVPSRMSSSTRPKSGTREQRASRDWSWNGRVLQMLRFISSVS